jgi:uncharacterized protein
MKDLTLTEIWIYPIKSLGGISLPSAKVLGKGLEHDRRWMLIDSENKFMTQRIHPQMALFKLAIADKKVHVTKSDAEANKAVSFSTETPPIGERIKAKIWDDEVDVFEINPELSQWFSNHLQIPVRLVSFPELNARAVDPKFSIGDDHVSLADAYPFLIIGQSSLDDLNRRLSESLPMNRFRPNFVFSGGEAYEEDGWREFSIGENRFVGVKPCARCALPTVNQDTAEKGTEPLATLSTYRRRDAKVLFGQNLISLDQKRVNVGDKITVH